MSEKKKKTVPPVTEPTPTEPEVTGEAPKPLTVEERLDRLESYTEQGFKTVGEFLTKLEPLTKAIEARQAQPPAPAPGGDIMGALGQFLPMLLGGGGSSPITDEITKEIIGAGMKQMFAGTRLLETIQNKIMTDMGVKAVTEAVKTA